MHVMKRRMALLLAGLSATASIAGCDVFSGDSSDGSTEATGTLRIAVTPALDTAALRIGVRDGRFERAGLTIELNEQPDQNAALAKLKAGEVDIAFAGNVALLRAAAAGTRLQLQGEAYQAGANTMALVSLPDSGYREPKDKPAPRIAVDTDPGVGSLTTRSALRDEGLNPDDVTFVPRPFHTMGDALSSRQVDAAWVVEPHLTKLQKELGATVVLDTAKGTTAAFPMSGYASMRTFADASPDLLEHFRNTLSEVQRTTTTPRAQQELPTFADVDPTTAALVSIGEFPERINHERVQRVADLMQTFGLIRDRLDVNGMSPPEAQS